MTLADRRSQRANEFCREILPAVSRTFALGIRVLPGPLGRVVRDAYLICRIADTIEDEPQLPAAVKAELFDALAASFDGASAVAAFTARAEVLTGDPAHIRLVRNPDLVFESFADSPEQSRRAVRRWVGEMIVGMRKFALAYPSGVRIQTVDEYREYCYYVAGTVGYMVTDLWHEHSSAIGSREYQSLRDRCLQFAEALQTVNILKDVARDADHENSIYVPEQLLQAHGSSQTAILALDRSTGTRVALDALVNLAWKDLDEATAYLLSVPRRAPSIRLFCALPLLFAYATLRELTSRPDAVLRREVVKISRSEVRSLVAMAFVSVFSNRLLRSLIARTRRKRRSN